MINNNILPDYIFESSWEVCNKVGGIYTVLSTRAKTMQTLMEDRVVFIGPDLWKDSPCQLFEPDESIFADWQKKVANDGLKIKVGRWSVPGKPIAVLVDFSAYYNQKNDIYTQLWNDYHVDSIHAYGDYDDASMFAFAAAKVVESFVKNIPVKCKKIIYHGNEWMTGLGLLYIKKYVPQVATVFTTHATTIGRSIAFNGKSLYDYFYGYFGDQMAQELNVQSKHSIEKQTAHNVDCFTTVSNLTAKECKQFLDKAVNIVTPNGFEDDFVPKGIEYTIRRNKARKKILRIANALTGKTFDTDTLILSISGRNEYRNKGIDIFLNAMTKLSERQENIKKEMLAVVCVPCWHDGPRFDLQSRLSENKQFDTALSDSYSTHILHSEEQEHIAKRIKQIINCNKVESKFNIIMIPVYLDGNDGIVDLNYYDFLICNDLCVYPSYYEPWGYTPLEAVAFRIPCITTNLAGFGLWVREYIGMDTNLMKGVDVIERNDHNNEYVEERICNSIVEFSALGKSEIRKAREKAQQIAKKALWCKFFKYYIDAYDIALSKMKERNQNNIGNKNNDINI